MSKKQIDINIINRIMRQFIFHHTNNQVWSNASCMIWNQVWNQVYGDVHNQVWNQIRDQVRLRITY